jgi:hypothetical protein
MEITKDITFHYIARLRHHTDELGLIVQGHLLIEFILNKIIRRAFKKPTYIVKDHRSYTFAIKAQVLYSTGNLPEYIYRNIRRINSIRNHLAHNLDWDALILDYRFSSEGDDLGGEVEIRDPKTRRRVTTRKYIKMLCFGTLSDLRNHFFKTYGEFPAPKW